MRLIWFLGLLVWLTGCGGKGTTKASDSQSSGPDGVDVVSPDGGDVNAPSNLPPGSACSQATECAAGLICAFAKTTDQTSTCVDPKAGVYDDGSDPAKRLEDAGNGWLRKRLDNWQAENLVCNDGSPYAYYVSPGTGIGADKWIIFFKGGASCADHESCAVRWSVQPNYMRQWRTVNAKYNPGNRETVEAGIYSNTGRTDNQKIPNAMANWNIVHLHYCSSDVFIGTALASENSLRLAFRGNAITQAVIKEVLAGFDTTAFGPQLPKLSDASVVVIAGGSAGATGARHNMDMIADMIKADGRDAIVVRGLADSTLDPPTAPADYDPTLPPAAQLWKAVFDADCLEAHPTMPRLCSDTVHLITGRGIGVYLGAVDAGHLGKPASTETHGVKDYFLFMATLDGQSSPSRGNISVCTRDECNSDADCGPGKGCLGKLCLVIEPCQIAYCTPGLGADPKSCLGVGDPAACLALVASHQNACNESASCPGGDGCCQDGERCLAGFCLENKYLGCTANSDCPIGHFCRSRVCVTPPGPQNSCTPGYTYESDTGLCNEILGCSPQHPCGTGYSCLPGPLNPWAQRYQWGLTEEFKGLGPSNGVYIVESNTHTVVSGEKFYGFKMPRLDGDTVAEVFNQWLLGSPNYKEHISRLQDLPLPLWTWDVKSITADGLTARTSGTGCENDAILILICDRDSKCEVPADALGVLGVGDKDTSFLDGGTAANGVPLKLVARKNPNCGASSLSPGAASYITLRYQYGADANKVHDLKLPIPGGGGLVGLPVTLYIGAAGTLYVDQALTTVVAGRVE